MKIFEKERKPNGRRRIKLFGITIISYKKAPKQKLPPHIEKKKLDREIRKSEGIGVDKNSGRNPKIIVSLTSFPERIGEVHYAIYSLLNQSLKPDAVILWLGTDEFPNGEADLPETLMSMKKRGLTINWCPDIKSYKKLVPALEMFPDDVIITADDDNFYSKDTVRKLYDAYLAAPQYTHCLRAHKIKFDECGNILPYNQWEYEAKSAAPSFNNFQTGVGGVLYPPKSLAPDVIRRDLFMKLAPAADDVWFWAAAVRNKTKINLVDSDFGLVFINPERELGLNGETILAKANWAGGNDVQIKNVIDHFNINLSFDSGAYWESRYKAGGNSGAGSYDNLAEFKAEVINEFVQKEKIGTVIEFGVGDGNQLRLAAYPEFIGFDVSDTCLETCRQTFAGDKTKAFRRMSDYAGEVADLTLSLDVLYHLIEDDVFDEYMRALFKASEKFVIIYASNRMQAQWTPHVKHRKFTDWIEKNIPAARLVRHIPNKYPATDNGENPHTSFADFYIYEK